MRSKARFALEIIFLVLLSLAMGEMISGVYHTSMVASTIWFFAAMVMVLAWTIYKDASLPYFNGKSGAFQARFSAQARVRFLWRAAYVVAALVIVGLLVQAFL